MSLQPHSRTPLPDWSVGANGYDGPEMHRLMVADEPRTRAFERSVRSTVKPGMVVLDVGAGSGILSLFAAQAGAARVYAVERAPGAAAIARRMAAANGYAEVIRVIQDDADTVVLPELADVLVSEWLGAYGVDENMLAPVLTARDRWLKPGGTMLPSSAAAWLAPVEHPAGRQAMRFKANPYGLNLAALDPYDPNVAVWLPDGLETDCLRAEPQMLWTCDCGSMPSADARTPFAAELDFELSGPASAVAAWFSAEMPGAQSLSNAPGAPHTHWGILVFPIGAALSSKAGDGLHVGFHNVPGGPYGSNHIWAAGPAAGPLEVHDTRRRARPSVEPPWRVYEPDADRSHGR